MSGDGQEPIMKELPLAAPGPIAHGPSSTDPILGIDLGTTNSLAAIVWGDTQPKVIPARDGGTLVPSVVRFLADGSVETGSSAREQRVRDAEHVVYSAKRLLGRGLEDIRAIQHLLPLNLEGSSAANVKILVGGRSYTPIEISAMILREIKENAQRFLGRAVEDAVITVPAYFNDSQRQATRAAGRLAGFNVLRILNEPTAASLAYGLQRKRDGLIAVYDLGGGTFDISVLKLRDGIFEVLATNGDTQLGGDDMDHAVAAWIESQARARFPDADFSSREARAALLDCAERLKIQLSTRESAAAQLAVPPSVRAMSVIITRERFAELVASILERTRKPVLNALKDSGLLLSELTDVVLVGGPTRLPIVREMARELFHREPNCSLHPEEVVALGAAIQADILAGHNQDFLLLDVVPLSLGIETFGGGMSRLIPRNTRVPAMATESFTTYVDGQTKVAINVYQGERELVRDNRKLSELVLHGIPPLPAGAARIEVSFLVDADGILSVTARELRSGLEASIEVKPGYGLTDAEVERMLAEGLAHQAEDRGAAALVDARNRAGSTLTATEKGLAASRELLDPAEVERVEGLVRDLKTRLATGTLEEIRSSHDALEKSTAHLAKVLMEKTLEEGLANQRVSDLLGKR